MSTCSADISPDEKLNVAANKYKCTKVVHIQLVLESIVIVSDLLCTKLYTIIIHMYIMCNSTIQQLHHYCWHEVPEYHMIII